MKFDRVSSARALASAVAFGGACLIAAGAETPNAKSALNTRQADMKSVVAGSKAPADLKLHLLVGEEPAGGQNQFPVGTSCAIDDGLPGNCQLPNQAGNGSGGTTAATSDDAAGFAVSDNLSIAGGGIITSVCWWGTYTDFVVPCPGPDTPDMFTITFYNNNASCPAGVPGSIKAGPFAVVPVSSATGNVIPSGLGDLVEWSFSAAVPAVVVADGECVWMEIKNNTAGGTCLWLWSTAPPGDNLSFQAGAAGTGDYDLAWCTNAGALAVPDCSLQPIAQCIGAEGACGEGNGTPGCDDPCCCSLVCQDDIFCCDSEWDDQCAQSALTLGCATFPLCASCDQGGYTYSTENAFNSTRDSAGVDLFIASDDFTPSADASITNPCWQGAYIPGDTADSFRIRYLQDTDGDHYPETVIASFSQADASLTLDAKNDTGQLVAGAAPIFQYEATHAAVPVMAGECYWLEISNDIGAGGTSWFWEMTERGPVQANDAAPPKQGNGLFLIDGVGDGIVPPDGFNFGDDVTDLDLAFCLGIPLSDPACGFTTVADTGQHQTVLFNGAPSHLGWSSGALAAPPAVDAERRAAQAFTLGPSSTGFWEIRHLLWAGFDPGAVVNEFENFEIHARTSFDVPPTPASLVDLDGDLAGDVVTVGHGGFDGVSERSGFISTGLFLPPGTYWLVFYASNDDVPFAASNLAWFTNAHSGVNHFCTPASPPPAPGFTGCTVIGDPKMLRARNYPAGGGFGSYTLPLATLDVDPANDPTPDPNDKYNAEFVIRAVEGLPALPCPWDCQATPEGTVGINDLLDLLAQWGGAGACDFDGGGVGITDLLKLLANWGPCP